MEIQREIMGILKINTFKFGVLNFKFGVLFQNLRFKKNF